MNPTPQQQKVIDWSGTRLAVVAGPGSGKTATLIAKVKAFTNEQRAKTAMLTFTIAAATELKERLGESKVAFVGTLHSWCARMLREHGGLINLDTDFAVVSAFEADLAFDRVYSDSSGKVSKGAVQEKIDWARFLRGKMASGDLAEDMAAAYMGRMLATRRLDYDALLNLALLLLEQAGVPREEILIVDEVQDSSVIDWKIYDAWNPKVLIAVGDLDQSIYGFRKACPLLFSAWVATSGVDLLMMEKNFRSDQAICAAGNGLMREGKDRISKRMASSSKKKGRLILSPYEDREELKASIIGWTKGRDAEKASWAVLCRTNREVASIRTALTEAGVVTEDSQSFGPVNHLSAFLDVVCHPYNDANARRALAVFRKDLHAADITRLDIEARSTDTPLSALIGKYVPDLDYAPFIRDKPFDLVIWKPIIDGGRIPELAGIEAIIATLDPSATAQDLAQAVLELDRDTKKAEKTVRTIHKAKGLEWDAVLIPSLDEGEFPPSKAERLEESRRLLFVGLTRARHHFTGYYDQSKKSRFIDELMS